jgi:hypothetical protein
MTVIVVMEKEKTFRTVGNTDIFYETFGTIFEDHVEVKLQMWEVRVGYGQEYRF